MIPQSYPNGNSCARGRAHSLSWQRVGLLYRRELRAALREKTIVLNSILIPVFLYPFLLWVAFTALTFVMGWTERSESRVAITSWPQGHPALRLKLEHLDKVELVSGGISGISPEAAGHAPVAEPRPTPDAQAYRALEHKVKTGELEAVLEFLPATNQSAELPGNFQARITYDRSKERSVEARDRLEQVIDLYRADWLKREARRRGIDAATWQGFTLSSKNMASRKQMGRFVLGLVAPIMFVVMVAIGCFYPAVDATAGERERNTWETLISSAASPTEIATAKYLYVATLGGVAGILNLAAVMLTLKPIFAPLMAAAGQALELSVPLTAVPVALLAAVLLAGFVAAGMLLFASFARTFKEGQAMITPFYMMILLPSVFLQAPGVSFTPITACVPVVNLTLMVREALTGVFHWGAMAITAVASILFIALCVRAAAFILQFEDVILGSYGGSFFKFCGERLFRRLNSP